MNKKPKVRNFKRCII